ncbi:hypothetical protein EI016_24615, partial [Escherichia coli]|nr:hypothetical protein [Escherichia coli]
MASNKLTATILVFALIAYSTLTEANGSCPPPTTIKPSPAPKPTPPSTPKPSPTPPTTTPTPPTPTPTHTHVAGVGPFNTISTTHHMFDPLSNYMDPITLRSP